MKALLNVALPGPAALRPFPGSPRTVADARRFADALGSDINARAKPEQEAGRAFPVPGPVEKHPGHPAEFRHKLPEFFSGPEDVPEQMIAPKEAPTAPDEAAAGPAPDDMDAAPGREDPLFPHLGPVVSTGDLPLKDVPSTATKAEEAEAETTEGEGHKGDTTVLPGPGTQPFPIQIVLEAADVGPPIALPVPGNTVRAKAESMLRAEAPSEGSATATPAANLATPAAEPTPAVRSPAPSELHIDPVRLADVARARHGEGGAANNAGGETATVRVLESHAFPAPAQPTASPAASVLNGIAGSREWSGLAQQPALLQSARMGALGSPVRSLTIQLHPVELGAVTARLHGTGEQLSIEIQVEQQEAYRQLSTDSDTILKAVRALGIEIDRITIVQPQGQAPAAARGDITGQSGSAPGGDFAAPGDTRHGGEQSGRSNQGNRGRDTETGSAAAAPSGPSGVSHGVYI